MLVHEFLTAAAERASEAIALIAPGGTVSFGDLNRRANRVAHALISRGVHPSDRVVLALQNGIDFVAGYFGVMKAGAIAVPVPSAIQNGRFAAAVADCSPAACVIEPPTLRDAASAAVLSRIGSVLLAGGRDAESLPLASAIGWEEALDGAGDGEPDRRRIDQDLAAIIYTSGSTGEPRGVMLSHLNIRSNTDSIVSYLRLTSADRVMCVLPLYYVYGLSLLHTHVRVGGSLVIDNRFAFPNVVLAEMQEREVTGFAGVPSTFALLLHRSNLPKMRFPHLRYVTQAGGGMAPALIRQWREKVPDVPFYVMYGATEASARLTYLEPTDLERKLGSIGRAIPNVEICVTKEDGTPARPFEVGELVARGSNISAGYWNNLAETRERFGPEGYRTGDLGYADDEGFLFLVGRRHDMIKVGAHRVGAKEIEDVLHEHPSIHEAAVVGAPDPMMGEVPVAFVVARDEKALDLPEIQAFCRSRLAAYKVPRAFVARASLPKNDVGKLDKAALRRAIPTALSGAEGK